MAAPVPYRAESNTQQYTPSFPPPIYYRDTFGLQHVEEHPLALHNGEREDAYSTGSAESGTTKSTVRNQINIFHTNASVPAPSMIRLFGLQPRRNTGFSSATSNHATLNNSQHSQQGSLQSSTQVEELLINNQFLLIFHAQHFLWISMTLFGMALQMLIFSVVCLFFDGHWLCLAISTFLLCGSIILLIFVRYKHTWLMMWLCICSSIIAILFSILLFCSTVLFLHNEDMKAMNIDGFDDLESNKIVQNARSAMYILILVYSPVYTICAGASLYILLKNLYENGRRKVHKGFFLSRTAGHQKVLVPIKLRQIEDDQQEDG